MVLYLLWMIEIRPKENTASWNDYCKPASYLDSNRYCKRSDV